MYSAWSCSPTTMSSCSEENYGNFSYQSTDPDSSRSSICPICADIAYNRHFGSKCCNSCAGQARHMCKFCRLQRCIWNGLSIATAVSRIPDEKKASFAAKSRLKQLVGHQQETFLRRFKAAVEIHEGHCERVLMGQENPSFLDTINATKAEFVVLNDYLKASEFSSLGLDDRQIYDLARSIFYSWICFTTVTTTARNGGFKNNEIYYVDESHMRVDYHYVLAHYRSCSTIIDADQCSRIALDFYSSVLNSAQKLHSARLDEDEVASMFQLIAYKGVQRLFVEKDESIRNEMNVLFQCLREHYDSAFDDTAVRMGNLILLTDEIESLTRQFNEFVVILTLNGYTTVLSTTSNNTNAWTYT
ncbi:hypothetical protein M3Y96_01021400 [Aphelenchoides besseyi]|nr:hypothetical protein M3Y96_01021400 [Aphelenchoides besseyi]